MHESHRNLITGKVGENAMTNAMIAADQENRGLAESVRRHAEYLAWLAERSPGKELAIRAAGAVAAIPGDAGEGIVIEGTNKPWRIKLVNQSAPFASAGMLCAAAAVAHNIPGAWPLVSVVYLVVVVCWRVWANKHAESSQKRLIWGAPVVVGSAVWLLWAAVQGLGGFAPAVLAAGTGIFGMPFWIRNAIPTPPDPNEPDSKTPHLEVTEHDKTFIETQFDAIIAADSGALPGAYLISRQITDEYERYTIQLRLGVQTTNTAISAAERIASAFGMGMDAVSVSPHLTGDQSKAVLQVATRNPLQETIDYPDPLAALDMTNGIRGWIGKFSDGRDAWWDYYRKGYGAKGGMLIGATRSGKSELLTSIMLTAAYSRRILVLPACPQGGASFPEWIKYGHWSASSPAQILRQARAVNRALTMRSKLNSLRGDKIHVPTLEEPLLLWVIDECHEVIKVKSEIAEIADRIARQGAKVSMALILASHSPELHKTFANLDTLRNSLLSGTSICLRIPTRDAKSMMPGLLGNPAELPLQWPDGSSTSGLGFVIGEHAPFRAGRVRNSPQLVADAPQGEIERATASYMGPDYTERHTRALTDRAITAAEIEREDPELVASLTANDPELAKALASARTVLARREQQTTVAPDTVGAAPVAAVHRLAAAPVLRLVEDETADVPKTAVAVILDLLHQGVTRKKNLIERSGYSETQVRNALNALVREDKIRSPRHGSYQPAA